MAAQALQRWLLLTAALFSAALQAQSLPAPPVSPAPVTNYEYDAQGNPTKVIQAPGVAGLDFSTITSYDRLERAKDSTDAKAGITRFEYNGRTELSKVTDPRSLATTYPRNGLGDVTSLTSPDTGAAVHTYDAAGNLKTRTDSRGVLAMYSYDALNRATSIVHSKAGSTSRTYGYSYDQTGAGFANGVGRLTSTTAPTGSSKLAYDAQGRVTSATQVVNAQSGANSAALTQAVGYSYDSAGNPTQLTYPSGRVLTLSYVGGQLDAMALKASATATAVNLVSSVQWEPFGAAKSWRWQQGAATQLHERLYDAYGRLVRYRLGGVIRDITYDAADRIVAYTHYDATTAAAQPSLNQGFGYDQLGRLTGITTAATSWTIGYDANGNRTGVTQGATTRAYTTAATSNRLINLTNPANAFTYDTAGNILTGPSAGNSYTATYNLEGRLATMKVGNTTTTYAHDALGQRVRKYGKQAASTVVFVYDQQGHLLGEYGNTGAAIAEYVWLGDEPIAVFMPNGTNPPSVFYIHNDHLGAPRAVLDTSNGLRWRWLAEPFGTTAPETNPASLGAFTFNLRHPGQYADAETGLFYNYFRDYDAGTGRYTQSDPIGLAGGINTYAYSGSAPTMYTDPTGLIRWTGSMGGGGLIGGVGASYYTFDLLSECVNGKQARVRGYAIGGSAGIGATAAGSRGTTVFEDNETGLRPDGFNGRFAMYGAGVAMGRGRPGNMASEGVLDALGRPRPDNGISWSDVILGNARTAPGSNFGTVRGLDLSASFSAGSSIVTSVTYTDCECRK